jgi:hypothetical protein
MNQRETTQKLRRHGFKWGALLILALFLSTTVWLRSSQAGMTDTSSPDVVLSDEGSTDQEQELRDVDPPDPDLSDREVDPPDPDLSDREVDPPDPDLSLGEVDPPDPDFVP